MVMDPSGIGFGLADPFCCNADDLPPAVDRDVDFGREILPLLQKQCWSCHGGEKRESGLKLDSRSSLVLGGDLARQS